jgi:hypothetical protein
MIMTKEIAKLMEAQRNAQDDDFKRMWEHKIRSLIVKNIERESQK